MPYSGAVQLQREANGDVYGQDNNTGVPDPQLYQLLNERWGVSNPQSLAVGI